MPTHSPSPMSKFRFLTAWTSLSCVSNSTLKSRIWRIGSLMSAILVVERVAQAVTDEVEAEQRDRHEQRREDQHPRCGFHMVLAVGDEYAPGRQRILNAQ